MVFAGSFVEQTCFPEDWATVQSFDPLWCRPQKCMLCANVSKTEKRKKKSKYDVFENLLLKGKLPFINLA